MANELRTRVRTRRSETYLLVLSRKKERHEEHNLLVNAGVEKVVRAQKDERDSGPVVEWLKRGTGRPQWSEASTLVKSQRSVWHNGTVCA